MRNALIHVAVASVPCSQRVVVACVVSVVSVLFCFVLSPGYRPVVVSVVVELTDEVSVDPFTLRRVIMHDEIVGEYTPIEFIEIDVLDSGGEPTTELRIALRFDSQLLSDPQMASSVPF